MRQFRLSTEQYRAQQTQLREEAITKEFERLKGRLQKNQRIIRLQGILLTLFGVICFILLIF